MKDFEKELQNNFNKIMDSISEELLISNDKGKVMRVSPSFEFFYGLKKEQAIGKTVYELENEGYFKPSVIAKVIEKKEKITTTQKNNNNRDIIVTATPVFGDKGEIKFIVSYSRDITELVMLKNRYSKLLKKMEKYTAELCELRKDTRHNNEVIWKSIQMSKIMETINRVADLNVNVLLLGESGVGKSMLAKVLHQSSNRAEAPFIDINCAAIPENLLESELFGYEAGAFTGAGSKGKIGLMELADGGTLLLDEISEIPLTLQAKLLKAIQEKSITRVGGTKSIKIDFRLISASNCELDKYVEEGSFRKDLFYRLNVVCITIPPLRERDIDIIPLLEHFSVRFQKEYGLNTTFTPKAKEYMTRYSWPGNIRELSNVIERALVTCEGNKIEPEDVKRFIGDVGENVEISTCIYEDRTLQDTLEEVEKTLICRAYNRYHTTVGVARALDISQPTAYRKIHKYLSDTEVE